MTWNWKQPAWPHFRWDESVLAPLEARFLQNVGEQTRAHVERLAKRHGISDSSVSDMIDAVRTSLAQWPVHAEELGVHASREEVSERLAHMNRVFV